tara:strand:- start:253 stop:468 length:216 start_codon:yes stop_codon:yes gene_type:complete
MIYTYTFQTFDERMNLSAVYEIPFKGYANEAESYAALESMFTFSVLGGETREFYKGDVIGDAIICNETEES